MNQNLRNCIFILTLFLQIPFAFAQDTIAPVITLNPHSPYCIEIDCTNPDWVDPGYKAIDNVDGDITNSVIITGNVNLRRVNQYTITYIAKDNAGNADTAYRHVCVANTKGPFMPPRSFNPNVFRNGNEFLFATYQISPTRFYHKWLLDGDTLQSKTNEIAVTYQLKDKNQHEICILENYCNSDTLISYCSAFSDTTSQYHSKWVYAESYRDNNNNCKIENGDEKIMFGLNEIIYDDTGAYKFLIGSFEGYSAFGFIDTGKYYYIGPRHPFEKDTLNEVCLGRSKTILPQTYLDTALKLTLALNCKTKVTDYNLDKLLATGRIFPGQNSYVKTWINNLGKCGTSNQVNHDTGRIIFTLNGPAKFTDYVRNGYALDSISNKRLSFKPMQLDDIPYYNSLCPIILVDTNAQMTDSILVTAYIETNAFESNKNNNVYSRYFKVGNSYDPNMKEVDHEWVDPGFKEKLTYTIYFQNTGNAEAINIKLLDTLSQLLDTSSFEFISSSHQVNVTQKGQYLKFDFKDINLPDSHTNESGSHGYVSYSVVPTASMTHQTSIKNTAYIYFDFNSPVVTNTVNTIAIEKNSEINLHLYTYLKVYPNPTAGLIFFTDPFKIITFYEVKDISGRVVSSGTCSNSTIDISALNKGIYIISFHSAQGLIHGRIVKM